LEITGPDLLEVIDRARDELVSGDLERAREFADEAVQIARSSGSDVILGDALEVFAGAHARSDNPMPGLAAALEGAGLAQARGDRLAEARSLALAGSAYLELSEPADALVALERAIACLEGADDPPLEAEILHSAGWAMKEVGRADAGRELALRAIERAAGTEHRSVRANALVSLGDIEADIAREMPDSLEREEVLDRAQEALNAAVELARATGNTNFEARALGNAGGVWALRGQHEIAIETQQRALDLMLEGGDIHAALEAYLRLGRSERALARNEVSREHLECSLELSTARNAKFDQARANEELALIAESEGEFEAAYRHLARARTLEREIAGDRAVRSAELMALRVAAEESSREAAQLREQSRTLTELSEELRREREVFAQQALVDPLTGLANRRALEQTFAALVADAPASQQTVAVADIDQFKEINDRFGHAAGDNVLRTVAGILERFARREDLVCRYGGEEFVLVLGSYDPRLVRSVTERIRAAIETHPWATIDPELTVTISIGVAAGLAAEIDSLLLTADGLLYRAKRAGRNQVEHAGRPRPGRRERTLQTTKEHELARAPVARTGREALGPPV
jgi:diguanylate cyclase (GGDEF)-like protein